MTGWKLVLFEATGWKPVLLEAVVRRRVEAALRWVSAWAGVCGRSLMRSVRRVRARAAASDSMSVRRAEAMRSAAARARSKSGDSRRSASSGRVRSWIRQSSRVSMEGFRRSSRIRFRSGLVSVRVVSMGNCPAGMDAACGVRGHGVGDARTGAVVGRDSRTDGVVGGGTRRARRGWWCRGWLHFVLLRPLGRRRARMEGPRWVSQAGRLCHWRVCVGGRGTTAPRCGEWWHPAPGGLPVGHGPLVACFGILE